MPGLLPVSAASPSMDHEHGTVCQPTLEHQIRPSAPSSVISRPTCFSSSLRCCWQVGSAPFVRRRCDCLASSAPFTNIQTYLLSYSRVLASRHIGQQFDAGEDDSSQCVQPLLRVMLALVRSSRNALRYVFFGRRLLRLPSSRFLTLQTSRVSGLVDAVCGLPCGIYALLQYLPIFLNQFSVAIIARLYGNRNTMLALSRTYM